MFQQRLLPLLIAAAASAAYPAFAQEDTNDSGTSTPTPTPVPISVEEVVVQGVRSAELNAREMERDKDIFSSVISQDDAGNFADQNVAEAL